MSTNIGIWSPSDLILPTVESDLDYKFFFVTDAGSIDGLNISFKAGDWLVYIKKDGVGSWYKTSGGIVSFNTSTSSNAPDPGFYTKVQLDNNGNIIDASYIGADDLPKHSHDIDTITGDWETKVKSYVGSMFQNKTNGSIKFVYDSSTQSITADVIVDGTTISQDDFGELTVIGGSGNSGTAGEATSLSGTIKIEQVEDLSDRLDAVDANIQKNFIVCNPGSALKAKYEPEGTYMSVRFDGTSLVLNADGELSVAPNLISGGGATDGSDITCGAHTHTASQITDFEAAVTALVQKNSVLKVEEIPIDNQTIILNSSGQLCSVASGTRAHKHTMNDISDLNQGIANVWASNQKLQPSEDYSNGKFNFNNTTIGYSVRIINEYLKDLDVRVTSIENKVNSLEPPKPNGIEFSNVTATFYGNRTVYDKDTLKELTACTSLTVNVDYFYPAVEGRLEVYIDSVQVYKIEMNNEIGLMKDGNFRIVGIRDSYYGNALYMGTYKSMSIQYTVSGLNEGYHKISFIHTALGEVHKSEELSFQTYSVGNIKFERLDESYPSNNNYVSGIKCYKGDGKVKFLPKIKGAYVSQFIHLPVYQYKVEDEWFTPEILAINSDGSVTIEEINVYVPNGRTGMYSFTERAFVADGTYKDIEYNVPSLLWNNTDFEEYRVILPFQKIEGQNPAIIGTNLMNAYSPEKAVPQYEMVIMNGIGRISNTDYTNYDGADYSLQKADLSGYVWVNFKFPAKFMPNVHMDLLKGDGTTFNVDKDGTLKDVQIYISEAADNEIPLTWIDGNVPYIGYGSASGLENAGLDLFKSTNKTRYITFGQRPYHISEGNLYVRVGVKSNVDLRILVSSVKESINEWS